MCRKVPFHHDIRDMGDWDHWWAQFLDCDLETREEFTKNIRREINLRNMRRANVIPQFKKSS